MELHKLTATELVLLLKQKQICALDIVTSLLDRINEVEPSIRAFLEIYDCEIIEAAKLSDRRRYRGKCGLLEGIPIALKDNICFIDHKTTCASKMLHNFIAPYNAHVTEKIIAAGGLIIGKTNMDEFAMGSSSENSARFCTRNPQNLEYSPGGSSSGSAAAVAAKMVPLALGSDTGGSVRQPASFTGIYGLKPTYSRISRYGLVAFASSFDQIGPMARSVSDIALLLQTIAGHDPRDATSSTRCVENYMDITTAQDLTAIKIGVPREYFTEEVDREVAAKCHKALARLENAGATICEISLANFDYALTAYYLIAAAEASANLARYDGIRYGYRAGQTQKKAVELSQSYMNSRGQGFGIEVKRRILLGTYVLSRGYYDAYYAKALQARAIITREIEQAFKSVDALVTPTSPILPFKIGEKIADPLAMYLCDTFTSTFSLSGHPAISIPCGYSGNDLPVGLQLVGKRFDEKFILQVAQAYQSAKNT